MANDTDPPRALGTPAKPVSLMGNLIPWRDEQPVLLSMPGSSYFYIACFSTPEKLHEFMRQAGICYEKIKQVEDGAEFMKSLCEDRDQDDVKIIVDPYFLPNGRVRFMQVQEAE